MKTCRNHWIWTRGFNRCCRWYCDRIGQKTLERPEGGWLPWRLKCFPSVWRGHAGEENRRTQMSSVYHLKRAVFYLEPSFKRFPFCCRGGRILSSPSQKGREQPCSSFVSLLFFRSQSLHKALFTARVKQGLRKASSCPLKFLISTVEPWRGTQWIKREHGRTWLFVFWSFFLLSGVCFVPPRENKHVSVNSRWWQPGLHAHTRQHASIRRRFNWEGNDGLSSPRTTWNHCQLMGMRICITQPENNCGVHVERWQQVSFLSERLFLPRSAEGLLPAHTH